MGEPISIVLAAIITTIGTVSATVITVMIGTSKKKRKLEQDNEAKEKSQDLAAEEATYTMDRYESTFEFDDNGDGSFKRKFVDLRAKQFFQNLSIPFRLQMGGNAKILSVKVDDAGSSLPVAPEDERIDGGTVDGKLRVNGLFGPNTRPLSFGLEIAFQKGFYLTREETEEAYKDDDWRQEYATATINVPTQDLVLRVQIPEGWGKLIHRPQAVAFIQGSERIEESESRRLPQLQWENDRAALRVSKPKSGIHYVISWMPPRRSST